MATHNPSPLNAMLAQPAAAAIGPALRRVLLEAQASDAGGTATKDDASSADARGDSCPALANTLQTLHLLGADGEVLAAAILHTLPQLHASLAPRLARELPAVAALLEGQRAAAQVWTLHAQQRAGCNPEGLRRLLLAIVRDLRVIPILLARQLARLRAAATLPEHERRALAQLTRDIHAPLANRLGIWQLKWELEDLAFRHLEPDTYHGIARLLDDKRVGRERYIAQVQAELAAALAVQDVRAEVAGRPKHIFSIWKKMQKKNAPIGELYDLRALRVLVDDVPACYAALGVAHALWAPVPGEFDDYIARPKRNGYRSLHTAVIGPEGKTVEVQIRTLEMHRQAELGVAAHWRYKEGKRDRDARGSAGDAAQDRRIQSMRRLLDTRHDGGRDSRELLGELDTELVEDRVYVLTPMGEVVDLPCGATPLDFAYHVHTMVGHRCRGAKVDGRIVPLDYRLHSGDRVEILTGKTAEPRRDWLVAANGFLASPRSREKVRNWFHKLERARNVQAGRELLDKELKRLGLQQADLAPLLHRFNAASLEDLQVLVALGDVGSHQVMRVLLEHQRGRTQEPTPVPHLARKPRMQTSAAFTVVGVDNLLVQIARCCRPLPGEAIAGYLTRSRGVTVHRSDCAAFARLRAKSPQRVLPVEWGGDSGGYAADVLVDAIERHWLLKDLTNLIAQENAHVLALRSEPVRDGGRVRLRLQLKLRDFGQLSRLVARIGGLPGVEQVHRA